MIGLERFLTWETVSIANPASVFCEQNSGTSEIVSNTDGSQSGLCHLPDGNTCDEWAYFRWECPAPVVENTWIIENTDGTKITNSDQDIGYQTYTDNKYGFSFQYPKEWQMGFQSDHPNYWNENRVSDTRFTYDKQGDKTLYVDIYNTTYSSYETFKNWHDSLQFGNIISTKKINISKKDAIETLEREWAIEPSKLISFYFSNKGYTITFTYYSDSNIKDDLIKVLSTLEFTN